MNIRNLPTAVGRDCGQIVVFRTKKLKYGYVEKLSDQEKSKLQTISDDLGHNILALHGVSQFLSPQDFLILQTSYMGCLTSCETTLDLGS